MRTRLLTKEGFPVSYRPGYERTDLPEEQAEKLKVTYHLDLPARGRDSKKKPVNEAREFIRANWHPKLTATERMVLDFIFDKTWRFYNEEERFHISLFLTGQRFKTRPGYAIPPVTIKRRMLFYVLSSLREKGYLIMQYNHRGKSLFRLNITFTYLPETEHCKRMQDNNKIYRLSAMDCTPYIINNILNNETSYFRDKESLKAAPGKIFINEKTMTDEQLSRLRNVEAAERARLDAKRIAKLRKGNAAGLYEVWKLEMGKFYPKVPVTSWPKHIRKHMKDYMLQKEQFGDFTPESFIRCVIGQWPIFKSMKFPKMQNYPEYPAPGFVIKFFSEYLLAYYDMQKRGIVGVVDNELPQPQQSSRFMRPANAENAKNVAYEDLLKQNEFLRKQLNTTELKHKQDKIKTLNELKKHKERISYLEKKRAAKVLPSLNLPEWDE